VGTTLLRKHKILPHPREVRFPEVYPLPRTTKPRDLVIDTGNASISSSDASSPRTLKHTSKRIGGLPPTPPTHSRQSSGSHPTITIALNSMLRPSERQQISLLHQAHLLASKVRRLQMSPLQELCRCRFDLLGVIDIPPRVPTHSRPLESTKNPRMKTKCQNQP
jgi:hypothetical protein